MKSELQQLDQQIKEAEAIVTKLEKKKSKLDKQALAEFIKDPEFISLKKRVNKLFKQLNKKSYSVTVDFEIDPRDCYNFFDTPFKEHDFTDNLHWHDVNYEPSFKQFQVWFEPIRKEVWADVKIIAKRYDVAPNDVQNNLLK